MENWYVHYYTSTYVFNDEYFIRTEVESLMSAMQNISKKIIK